jgi:hypothetical protein
MTHEEAKQISGTCSACGRETTLADTCCGVAIYVQGQVFSPELVELEGDEEQ